MILPEKCSQNCGSPEEKSALQWKTYLIVELTYGHGSSRQIPIHTIGKSDLQCCSYWSTSTMLRKILSLIGVTYDCGFSWAAYSVGKSDLHCGCLLWQANFPPPTQSTQASVPDAVSWKCGGSLVPLHWKGIRIMGPVLDKVVPVLVLCTVQLYWSVRSTILLHISLIQT